MKSNNDPRDSGASNAPGNNDNNNPTFPPVPDDYSPEDRRHYEAAVKLARKVFEQLGGAVLLVPLHARSKRPVFKSWQRIPLDAMFYPPYLLALGHPGRNIAVLLRRESRDIGTFDSDTDQFSEEFAAVNPWATATLTTRGARGCNRWVRFIGPYPRSFDIKNADGTNIVEFRAAGRLTMIHGVHPSGKKYEIQNPAKPVEIRWPDIHWPDSWPRNTAMDFSAAVVPYVPKADESEEVRESRWREIFALHGEPFLMPPVVKKPSLNQVGFAALYCAETPLLCVPGLGFLRYHERAGIWKLATPESVKIELACLLNKVVVKLGIRSFLVTRTNFLLCELVGSVRGLAEKELPSVEDRARYLVLANGTLDLNMTPLSLLPHSPHFCALSANPHRYDPDAECPRWLAFLNSAVPPDDVLLLQKWVGLALSGKNSAHAVLVLLGVGGSGKSVIVDVVSHLIGRANCAELRTKHLLERFEMARFFGKTTLLGSDVPVDFLNLKGAQALKSLTGGDPLSAEFKNQNRPVEIRGIFNVLITSNSRLRVSLEGDGQAWRRRLKIVLFMKSVERQDPNFAKGIIECEMSGILNWALEGLSLLRSDYENEGHWVLSPDQQQRIDGILSESDSIRAFVAEGIEKGDPEWTVTATELACSYEAFCDAKGWEPLPEAVVRRSLPNAMQEVHGVSFRHDIPRLGAAQRGYRGARLKSPFSQTESSDGYATDTV